MSAQVQPYEVRSVTSAGDDGIGAVGRRLRRGFGGALHLPGEEGYEAARRPLFPSIDPRPAVVAEATGPADVRAAVTAAREHGLPLAVQATGHGTHVACGGGVLLKTSAMAAVMVDPARRVARVGAGARWADVLAAAAPFGLAPLSGSSPAVGVVGYTLGGGLGWLAREHGFAADSVVRAEVVTADGGTVTASADRDPELFWALRGGGGNFGVVTSLEFRLYPVTSVYAGVAYFPIERAAETLARYRAFAAGAPDAMSTAVLLRRMPGTEDVPAAVRGRRVLAIKAMYDGDPGDAERLLRPLREAAGPHLLDEFRVTPYAKAAMGGTACRHLDLFEELPDPVIDALVEAEARDGSPISAVEIRHWGGALTRPAPDAGPVGDRATRFSVIVDARVPDLVESLRPHATGGSFLNFLSDPSRTATAYTAQDHRRLTEVKRAYDPDNVFRRNLNIAPAPEASRRAARA
ncbi:FAD-binding oxidoreductase [Sphaerisporangium fuscum]|uniref:FAD-binding oxidoreductase n=1 Tax=Sphaerisporangium fuscum TaxID=2835868 RepID=UPI001BDC0AF5|nr:FAD-binding oxidoreductase [Sphaerisporangium fuscum]